MALIINKVSRGYTAQVTPPHGNNSQWSTAEPLSCDELIEKLITLGCHQTDIGDAFYTADPDWQDGNA